MIPFPFQAGQLGREVPMFVPVTPLLDLYGSAAAAWSTRKVRTAYAGACVRIRRSSDNTEQDIGFNGNGTLDESAFSTFVGAGSGFIRTWYDQSGNGLNIENSSLTAGAQPGMSNSGVIQKRNGCVTAYCNGTNSVLTSAFSLSLASRQLTVCAVEISTRTANEGMYTLHRSGGYDFQSGTIMARLTTPALQWGIGSGSTGAFNTTQLLTKTTPDSNTTALACQQAFVDGTTGAQSLFVDGAAKTLTTASGTLAVTGFMNTGSGSLRAVLGARNQNQSNTPSDFWQGDFGEMVIWAANMSADQAGIYANQKAHFGTP